VTDGPATTGRVAQRSTYARQVRVVVLGAGGIGGVVGGRLFQHRRDHGVEVTLIARGAQLDALQRDGLRLEDPDETVRLPIPTVGHPSEIAWRGDELVILATKTQDAAAAFDDLADAAPPTITVACATNGVEAERLALRRFADVLAINVMMPTAFLTPGVVQVISAPIGGSLDVGRYPHGSSALADELSDHLRAAQFVSASRPEIMRAKYRKLVMNTANAVEVACGHDGTGELLGDVAAEAEAVLHAAGIDVSTAAEEAAKRATMVYRSIAGLHRGGGSTWQSLVTGRSTETDYLNGEIVLIGRQVGIRAPLNAALQLAIRQMVADRAAPGSIPPAAIRASAATLR
jgi:2-dehydropantoate 2-reductase